MDSTEEHQNDNVANMVLSFSCLCDAISNMLRHIASLSSFCEAALPRKNLAKFLASDSRTPLGSSLVFTMAKITNGSSYLGRHLTQNDYYNEAESIVGQWVGKLALSFGLK